MAVGVIQVMVVPAVPNSTLVSMSSPQSGTGAVVSTESQNGNVAFISVVQLGMTCRQLGAIRYST